MPVSQACTPSSSSSSNKARRRAVVQMGDDLVEQQDGGRPRSAAMSRACPSRMAISSAFCSPVEHRPRACRRRLEADEKIAAVRPQMGTSGLGIGPAGRQPGPQPVLGGERGHLAEPGFDLALQGRGPGAGSGPSAARQHGAEAGDQVAPGGRDGDAALGDLLLQRVEPDGRIARLARGLSPRSRRTRSACACS